LRAREGVSGGGGVPGGWWGGGGVGGGGGGRVWVGWLGVGRVVRGVFGVARERAAGAWGGLARGVCVGVGGGAVYEIETLAGWDGGVCVWAVAVRMCVCAVEGGGLGHRHWVVGG